MHMLNQLQTARRLRLFTMLLLIGASSAAGADKPPNIVLLIGDDVGFSDLGAYGSEISTPHLDALAARGVRFTNFHATASCSPTRAILQTGVDHHRNGLGNMAVVAPPEHVGQPGYEGVLNDRVVTLARLLRDAGYHTYHVGKWHLGYEGRKLPFYRGFEHTITLADTGADNWEQRTYAPLYDKAHWFANGHEHQLPDDFYSSRYFIDKTIEFIEADRGTGQPFFAQVGFQAVHIPLQAPAEFIEKYADTYTAGWEALREARRQGAIGLGIVPEGAGMVRMPTTEDWNRLGAEEQRYMVRRMAVYAGMLDAMDHHIGRLIDYLKRVGEYDNTLFVFLSDNGPEPTDPHDNLIARLWIQYHYETDLESLGAKGAYAYLGPSWASAAAAPGSFYKFWAGEGGLRVPLIVSWPGRVAENVVHHRFAYLKDIMPTLLEFAGVVHPGTEFEGRAVEPLTGRSLAPVLSGNAAETHPVDEPVGYELAGNAALYKGAYKLVRNLPPLGDNQWHLYDILQDPGETRDLKNDQPERFAEMLEDFRAYERDNNVLPMPDGYEYMKQLQRNIIQRTVWPRLVAAAPWAGAGLLLVLVLVVWRRRRGKVTS